MGSLSADGAGNRASPADDRVLRGTVEVRLLVPQDLQGPCKYGCLHEAPVACRH